MTRLFISLACRITIFSSCTQSNDATHPNIILTDDQSWGDLSISGNANLEMPNINQLAEKGVTFDRFFVSPVCSTTRAEMLTGRHHPHDGVYSTSAGGEQLDPDEITIGDYFKKAGYEMAAFEKWHNGMQPPYYPNARGFDDFYGFCSGPWPGRTSLRSQRFRLDFEGKLFDMEKDPGQYEDVSEKLPEISNQWLQAQKHWKNPQIII